MLPRAHRSTSHPSAQPNIDPTVFGALSIADLRSLCVQHGIPSRGVRKTLERWHRELNTPSPNQVQNINEHEPAAPNNDETAAQRQECPEFTDGHKLQGLHFLTGHHFVKVCAAQGICDIHERPFLVLDVKIVMLKLKKHPLQPFRCVTETLLKDLLQGLVVCFHMDNVSPKNILVKFLASKHNSEELFLNLSVSGLSLG